MSKLKKVFAITITVMFIASIGAATNIGNNQNNNFVAASENTNSNGVGADIPTYSTEITESDADVVVGTGDTIQGALKSTSAQNPVILVKSGYNSSDETVGTMTHPDGEDSKDVLIRADNILQSQDWSGELTIVSENGPSETVIDAQDANYGIVIGGDTTVATVKGFDIRNYKNVGVLAGSWHNVESSSYVNPERVDVIHNYFGRGPSDKFSYGVELAYTTSGTIKYNRLEMQGLTGKKEVGSMLISETDDVVVSNNVITNGQTSDELGIAVATFGGIFSGVNVPLENVTIKNNTITGGNQGIGIESVGEMSDLTIKYNEITGSENAIDIVEYTSSGGTITGTEAHYNNFVNNRQYGIAVENCSVDATNNWWGDPSGPSGVGPGEGDAVSENVDYSPWLVGSDPEEGENSLENTVTNDTISAGDNQSVALGNTVTQFNSSNSGYLKVGTPSFLPGGGVDKKASVSSVSIMSNMTKNVSSIKINYTDNDVESIIEESLQIYRWNGTIWNQMPSVVNEEENYVNATVPDTSTLTVSGAPEVIGGSALESNPLTVWLPYIGIIGLISLIGGIAAYSGKEWFKNN